MTEIEDRLRAAMHAAVDSEEIPSHLLGLVMRRQRRRHVLLAVVAVLVALTAAVPAAIAVHTAAKPSPPSSTRHSTPPARLRATMTGLPMSAGTDFQLLIQPFNLRANRREPGWYSTATHRIEPIAGLPAYGAYEWVRVEGGWSGSMAIGGGGCPQYCRFTLSFIADGSVKATRIGVGFAARASDRADAVWLVSYPRSIVSLQRASARVQLVSTAGQPLSPPYHLPAGARLERGVASYLLLEGASRDPNASELWDPRTGHIVRRFNNVIAAGPDQVAWTSPCRGCRMMHILTVSTGKMVTTPITGGQAGLSGSFSDDGSLLAVVLANGPVIVFDAESGALTVIPGTALINADWQSIVWQGGGHRLVVTAGPGNGKGPDQIGYWQPGDATLRVATIRDQGEISVLENDFPAADN